MGKSRLNNYPSMGAYVRRITYGSLDVVIVSDMDDRNTYILKSHKFKDTSMYVRDKTTATTSENITNTPTSSVECTWTSRNLDICMIDRISMPTLFTFQCPIHTKAKKNPPEAA